MSPGERKKRLIEALHKHIGDRFRITSMATIVLGPEFVSQFALELDPLLRFDLGKKIVVPVNRVRKRRMRSYNLAVYCNRYGKSTVWSRPITGPNPNAPEDVQTTFATTKIGNGTWAASLDTCSDTTGKTRKNGNKFGECRRSQFYVTSSGRQDTWLDYESDISLSSGQYTRMKSWKTVSCWPTTGFLDTASLEILRQGELAYCDSLLTERGMKCLISAMPFHRDMSLFRSLVELREFPRAIQEAFDWFKLRSLQHVRLSQLGKDYVSYQFGWKPMIDDVKKLLEFPRTLPARVERLQRQILKDQTFHYRQKWFDDGPGTQFSIPYDAINEVNKGIEEANRREILLHAIVNCNVRFPAVLPGLPDEFSWARIVGLDPTISDLWKLIPWTWLIDWFLDFGDYIEAIAEFNQENSVINYGMLSCKMKTHLLTQRTVERSCRTIRKYNSVTMQDTTSKWNVVIPCTGILESYVRTDASSIKGIQCASTMSGLSTWRASILGALFAAKKL